MLFRTLLTASVLCGSLLASGPVPVHEKEDFEQPGIIQLQGISERDEVRIDGEVVPAKGLARTRYRLLIAPGEYEVSVRRAGSPTECVSIVVVDAGEAVRPNCVNAAPGTYAD